LKLGRILNKKLNTAIADMGHGDILVICDAGFPIPSDEQRIDLALEQDVPTIQQVLDLVLSDFCYEKVLVAGEMKQFNRPLFDDVEALCTRCPVSTMPYPEFMASIPRAAKYIVRTGAFSPYGNIALTSAVDAPKWFSKPGLVVPDVYKDRV
jgi:D-ribose pyranose/furanose isomerase RbsD